MLKIMIIYPLKLISCYWLVKMVIVSSKEENL